MNFNIFKFFIFLLNFQKINSVLFNYDYFCSAETWSIQRIRILTNEIYMRDKNEDYFYEHFMFPDNVEKFSAIIQTKKGKFLKVRNIHYVDMNLKSLHVPKHKKEIFHPLVRHIKFLFCPVKSINTNLFHFNGRKNGGLLRWTYGASVCSLELCEIGLYVMKDGTTSDKLEEGDNIDKAFYIAFKAMHNEALLFKLPDMYEGDMTLVPCPYVNWIVKNSLSRFQPAPYIKDDFPTIEDDLNRHRLTPTFFVNRHKKIDYRQESDKSFICGKIIQHNRPSVPVGFEFMQQNKPSIINDLIHIGDIKEICNGKKIKGNYVFGIIRKNNTYERKNDIYFYFTNENLKYYSGLEMYVYDKDEITNNRKSLLEEEKKHQNGEGYDFIYFYRHIHTYKPFCKAGFYADDEKYITGVLKLRIGRENIPSLEDENKETIYKISSLKGHFPHTLSCYIFMTKPTNEKYSEFYSKKFKTNIRKIKDLSGKILVKKYTHEIFITDELDEIYGTYECVLDTNEPFPNIKNSTFNIIPK
uniref:6-cysteine protein n=1 Tax=Parastrongyloides trichosuri TaxID=131310 RepID=A0A0N4ZPQ3_PARTI